MTKAKPRVRASKSGQTDMMSKSPAAVAELVKPPQSPVDSVDGDTIPKDVDATLRTILCWKRGYDTKSELEFMTWLHGEIRSRGHKPVVMAGGNVNVRIPTKDGKASAALFSCHTDTTHWEDGRQKIAYDPNFGHIFLDKKEHDDVPPLFGVYERAQPARFGGCLGADDGAGVWILLEMIKAGVPGTYLFHRGEEKGCIGAKVLLEKCRDFIEGHSIAVAFDRRDTGDVIITQASQPCASRAFGELLANNLNAHGLQYKPSDNGIYTDVRVYRGVIPECVNLSVGYADNHGPNEMLDYGHLVKLRDAVLRIDWEELTKKTVRNPVADTPTYTYTPPPAKPSPVSYAPPNKPRAAPTTSTPTVKDLLPEEELDGMSRADVEEWCADNPEESARLMIQMAAELAGLRATVKFLKGVV